MFPLPPGLHDITDSVKADYNIDEAFQGGMSDVFPGTFNGQKIAIKKLRVIGAPPNKIKERFLREATTWTELLKNRNDYVPQLLGIVDWGNEENRLGLVSPFYEDNNAMEYIKNKGFNEDGKASIFLGIAKGLKHIHDHNVIHGDIKLRNILFCSKGQPKITDFGLSRIQDITGFTTTVFGASSAYIAPEVFQKMLDIKYKDNGEPDGEPEKLSSKAADIYALAILAAEIFMESYHGSVGQFPERAIKRLVEGNYRPSEAKVNSQKYFPLLEDCWATHELVRLDIIQIVGFLEDIGRGGTYA